MKSLYLICCRLFAVVVLISACSKPRNAGPKDGDDLSVASQGSCDDAKRIFTTQIWPNTASTKCIACHTSQGAARATRLILLPGNLPETVQANFETFSRVGQLQLNGKSLLVQKPNGETSHGG